jgi:PEP-CTERM motif
VRRLIAFLFLLGLLGLASEVFATVQLSSGLTVSEVFDGAQDDYAYLDDLLGDTAVANIPGYSSTTMSLFSTAGNSASFSGSFDQTRQGAGPFEGGGSQSSTGQFAWNFTTDADYTYKISGSYSNTGGVTLLYSYLIETELGSYVSLSQQESVSGPAAFILGGTAGNYLNDSQGSLTGILPAGSYAWQVEAITSEYDIPPTYLGATASGGAILTLEVVPEPSALVLLAIGLVSFAALGFRRR